MVSRVSDLYKDALNKAIPNMDLNSVTDFYKKNLEYMSAINKVMTDITKTMYHVHVDFVKNLSAISKDVFKSTAQNANDYNSIMANTKDALNTCTDVCSNYSDAVDNTVKGSGSKIAELTKDHIAYTAEKIKNNPLNKMFNPAAQPS